MTAPTLIRNAALFISDDDVTYVEIKGITQLTHQPSTSRADATTFDQAGYTKQVVTSRGDSYQANGLRYEDESDGSRDPGQEAAEAAARQVGQAAQRYFKDVPASGDVDTDYIAFEGDVEVQEFGGGVNDLSAWGITVSVQTQPTYVTTP